MVNQQKIVTMTKLALYDKHDGMADRVANDYFRHDYIYKKNLGTRLAVGFGSVLILAIYWLRNLLIEEVDVFELNVEQHLTESILFILAVLAAYSLIGTIQGTREYYMIQRRLQQYQMYLRHLERAEERGRRVAATAQSPQEALSETRKLERERARREARRREREKEREAMRSSLQRTTPPISRPVNSSASRRDFQRRYGTNSDSTRNNR